MACIKLFRCPSHGHSHTSCFGGNDKKKRDGGVACSGKTFLQSFIEVCQFSEQSSIIWQFLSESRYFQHFKELEDAVPCTQQLATGPHPEPDESSPQLPMQFLAGSF